MFKTIDATKVGKRGVKEKENNVVSFADFQEAKEKLAIRKIATKKYEVSVDTGECYKSGRKKIKRELINGNKPDAEQREKELLEELKALKSAVQQLKPPETDTKKSSDKTFKEIAERWIAVKELEIEYNTWRRYRGIVYNHLLPFFEGKTIANIHVEDIEDYYLAKKEIKLTQHKVVIDAIFKYAAKTKKIISKEHARDIKEIRCPVWNEEEIECLTDEEELAKLLCSLQNSVVFLPAYIAIATGARLSEITALTWKDIDFDLKTVTFKKTNFHKKNKNEIFLKKKSTKNKNIRTLRITEKDIEVLKYYRDKQQGKPSDFVCLTAKGSLLRVIRYPRILGREPVAGVMKLAFIH